MIVVADKGRLLWMALPTAVSLHMHNKLSDADRAKPFTTKLQSPAINNVLHMQTCPQASSPQVVYGNS